MKKSVDPKPLKEKLEILLGVKLAKATHEVLLRRYRQRDLAEVARRYFVKEAAKIIREERIRGGR